MGNQHVGRKIVVGAFTILGVWWLLQNVLDSLAIWRFLADGIIPGTEATVSPDMVLASLPVIFLISTVLIFRKELLKGLSRSRLRHQEQGSVAKPMIVPPVSSVEAAESVKQPQLSPKPVLIIEAPRRPGFSAHLRSIWLDYITALREYRKKGRQRRLLQSYQPVLPKVSLPEVHPSQSMKALARQSSRGANRLALWYVNLCWQTGQIARRFGRSTGRGATVVWEWLTMQAAAIALGMAFIFAMTLRAAAWLVRMEMIAMRTLAMGLRRLVIAAGRATVAASKTARRAAQFGARAGWLGLKRVARYGLIALVVTAGLIVTTATLVSEYAQRAWNWAVPYMDRFDRWALARLQQYEWFHLVSVLANEYMRVINLTYKRIRNYLKLKTTSRA